jgi:serine/threonine protein kinase
LNHPNILACLGASLGGTAFFVTEFMDRGNLSDVLRADMDLSWKIKLNMARDVARGVLHLHTHVPPIVHRDLKSLNLLVRNFLFYLIIMTLSVKLILWDLH